MQEAILFGDIPAGIRITQTELAASLDVSRMPVREALIALEYQGLVRRHTNQHVEITALTNDGIHEIFSDMASLETETIRGLADKDSALLSSFKDQREFHRELCGMAGSAFRRKTLETFAGVYLAFVLNNSEDTGRIDAVFGNILEAVKNPDDKEILRAGYAVYSEVLANEFIRIRRKREKDAERQAGKAAASA